MTTTPVGQTNGQQMTISAFICAGKTHSQIYWHIHLQSIQPSILFETIYLEKKMQIWAALLPQLTSHMIHFNPSVRNILVHTSADLIWHCSRVLSTCLVFTKVKWWCDCTSFRGKQQESITGLFCHLVVIISSAPQRLCGNLWIYCFELIFWSARWRSG